MVVGVLFAFGGTVIGGLMFYVLPKKKPTRPIILLGAFCGT
jgi:hypothetical protein